MRKGIIGASVLLAVGLALFFGLRTPGSEDSPGSDEGSGRAEARTERPGPERQPEAPEDLGARGSSEPGSTPGLAKPPSEQDGVLEVQLVAGERPVPGATVRLYWRGSRDPNLNEVSWRLASTGVTDAEGRARLASRPGSYQVAVRAQGYGSLLRDVARPYGEARTLLRLSLEPGQTLSGRTVEADTKDPLPLAELVLTAHGRKLDRWEAAAAPAEERAYASSDAHGAFRVEGLAPGDYTLEARAAGHARTEQRRVTVPSAGPLTIELRKAGVIEGFVVDAQGRPAAGAEVSVGGRAPEVTTTGEGGGFSVEVEPGAYTLSARRGSEAGSLPHQISVNAGRTVRDLRIQLGQSAAVEGRVVVKSTGAPIEGARVDVSPYTKSGDSGRAVTDGSGRFSVGGLAPGSYDVVATAPGFSLAVRSGLTVAPGERFPVEFSLTGTGAVEGHVRDKAGQPVAGAQVTGTSRWSGAVDDAPSEARTDAEGHYRLEGLVAGSVSLSARREEEVAAAVQNTEVKEGDTTTLDFTLEATGVVEGVIRAARGALPSEPLSVNASMDDRNSRYSLEPSEVADASGHFRMVLPPGPYLLWVSAIRNSHYALKRVQVEAGKTAQVELTWTPPDEKSEAAAIQGTVLEPDGSPSLTALVTLALEDARSNSQVEPTDEAGHFAFSFRAGDPVTPSTRVRLIARNGGRTAEVSGVKFGEQSVVIRLQPAGVLKGQVVRSSGGAPVQGFTLAFDAQGRGTGGSRGPWEFSGQRFELGDVPAGQVRVRVWTADGSKGEALVSTSAGAVAEVQVAVKAPAGVRGRVVDASTREPLANARVFAEGESRGGGGRTGADGRFSLEKLAPGEYTLEVFAGPGRMPAHQAVTLAEGQVLEVGDIALASPPLSPGSIGAQLADDGTQPVVVSVIPSSPAAAAGLQEGDVVLTVDGAPVKTAADAAPRLRGAPGSTVVLTVRRAGAERSLTVIRSR